MSAQDLVPGDEDRKRTWTLKGCSRAGTPHTPHIHSLSMEDNNHNSDVDHNSFSSDDEKNHAFRTTNTTFATLSRSPVSARGIELQVGRVGVETAGLEKAPETPGPAAADGGTPNVPTGRQLLFDGFSPLLHWEQKIAVPDSGTIGSKDMSSKDKGHSLG